jgi:hypothetical protein
MDAMLGRLSDDWQSAQPPHLRHLAVIRDTAVDKRSTYYVYRTHDGFQKAVDQGDTQWELVRSRDKNVSPPPPMLDEWGFPPVPQKEVMNGGRATLGEVLASAKLPTDVLSSSDPHLVGNAEGMVSIAWPRQTTKTPVKGRKAAVLAKEIASSSRQRKNTTANPEVRNQYQANYRRERRLKEEAAERAIQIRKQSEGVAYEEVLAKFEAGIKIPNSTWLSANIKLTQPIFEPPLNLPKFTIVNALADDLREPSGPREPVRSLQPADPEQPEEVEEMPKRRGRPPKNKAIPVRSLQPVDPEQLDEVEEMPKRRGRPPKNKAGRISKQVTHNQEHPPSLEHREPMLLVFESRVLALFAKFIDTSRFGVHINPPGSKIEVPLKRGQKTQPQLMVVFKFPWLQTLGWYVSAPYHSPATFGTPAREPIDLDDGNSEPVRPSSRAGRLVSVVIDRQVSDRASDDVLGDLTTVTTPSRRRNRSEIANARSVKKLKRPLSAAALTSSPKRPKLTQEDLRTSISNPGIASPADQFDEDELMLSDPNNGEALDVELSRETTNANNDEEMQDIDLAAEDSGNAYDEVQPSSRNGWGMRASNYRKLEPRIKRNTPRKKRGTALGAGAVRFKRTQLILEIIDKCHGVFPGDGELFTVYNRMQKQDGPSRTDRDTIIRAVKSLVDTGKLKKVSYAFADKTGITVTKNLLLRPDLELGSTEAQLIMKCVQDSHPKPFHPVEVAEPGRPKQTKQISRFLHQEDDALEGTRAAESYQNYQKDMEAKVAERKLKNRDRQREWYYKHKYASTALNVVPDHVKDVIRTVGPSQKLISLKARVREQREAREAEEAEDHYELEEQHIPGRQILDIHTWENVGDWTAYDTYELPREPVGEGIDPEREETMAEILAKMGSFAVVPEEPATPESVLPSVETDGLRRRRQTRIQRDSEMDFWVVDDPASSNNRPLFSQPTSKALLSRGHLPLGYIGLHDPSYEWKQVTSFLDPDQNFNPCTGTFSTDFTAWKRVHMLLPLKRPLGYQFAPNVSSTRKRDIETFFRTDDRDYDYHPDHARKSRSNHGANFENSDSEHDEIQSAWHEKQEMRHMFKDIPGFAVDSRREGFVNYSLGHEQTVAVQEVNRYGNIPGDRITLYGTSAQYGLPEPSAPAAPRTGPKPGPKPSVNVSITRTARAMKQDPNCVITPEQARRLLFAIISVKTLAGGLDQTLRWPYISKIFSAHPNYDIVTFKARWGRMEKNNKELIARLTRDFQDMFLMAYQRNELPVLDAKDMEDYDWNAVVDWAVKNIIVFPEDVILPASRETLDQSFEVVIRPRKTNESIKEKMEHYLATNTRRDLDAHRLEVYAALALRPATKNFQDNVELSLARSWTRACSATEHAQFDPKTADAKLRVLDDKVVAEAIRQLHDEKVISHAFKGRHIPGRNYHLHDGYNMHFNTRALKLKHFAEAMAFKEELDHAFATTTPPSATIRYNGSDGQYMVISELLANGHIRTLPRLPPINSTVGDPWPRLSVWGFMEGHYRGRDTDKNVFKWDIDLVPTSSYVSNFALRDKINMTPPPSGLPTLEDNSKELIPIWRDIHGNLLIEHWRKLLYCVVQHIAFKAGSTIQTLLSPFKGLIWDWEMELLVGWLVKVGVARWTAEVANDNKGVMTKEWWWTVVPDDGAAGNDQGVQATREVLPVMVGGDA